jgi:hypothetical protein
VDGAACGRARETAGDTRPVPITRIELIEAFGAAADVGNGAVFVGAGLSSDAGLPNWGELLKAPQEEADVPADPDLTVVAEYILFAENWTRSRLEGHILSEIMKRDVAPTASHRSIAALPVSDVWTTNYDPLLERANPAAQVITQDDDVRKVGASRCTIVKMHGSIKPGPPHDWDRPPIITRSDFESYEQAFPRTWALLRATYLSRTFLFLGFSFTDPNVEILQKLARRNKTAVMDRHMTVMKRPSDDEAADLRRHDLKVRDLENSGVKVLEIAAYGELAPLLEALVRRTRPERLFVAGSCPKDAEDRPEFDGHCRAMSAQLAGQTEWDLTSLGGDAGWGVSRELAHIRRAEGTYDAAKIVQHFRATTTPAPPLAERVGTAVYTNMTREQLVPDVLANCRALLAIRGGDRTREEIDWALERGVGVVPLAASGGAARQYWSDHQDAPPDLGGRAADHKVWARLNSPDASVAARAAVQLLKQAMYATD